MDRKIDSADGAARRPYRITCSMDVASSSKSHSTIESGRLPFLIRSS
jgi:hypothetical protein